MDKNSFKSLRELDTTFTNPDGGSTKVLGIRKVEGLAKDVKVCNKILVLKSALYVPGYRTKLISVSSIIGNAHKVVQVKKKKLSLPGTQRKNSNNRKREFFLRTTAKKVNFADLSGRRMKPSSATNAFNHRDLKKSLLMDLKLHYEKCETFCLAITTKTHDPKQNENKASKAGKIVLLMLLVQ